MGENVKSWASVGSFLLALMAAVWATATSFLNLNSRIESLEAQISTISTGIAISSEVPGTANTAASGLSAVDPIAARCSDLAAQFAKAAQDNASLTVGRPIENLMERLGCFK